MILRIKKVFITTLSTIVERVVSVRKPGEDFTTSPNPSVSQSLRTSSQPLRLRHLPLQRGGSLLEIT
jgi:hypothetical protein